MKKRLAEALRTLAVVAVNLSEVLDPQPPVVEVHPWQIHTSTGTTSGHTTVTHWHETA